MSCGVGHGRCSDLGTSICGRCDPKIQKKGGGLQAVAVVQAGSYSSNLTPGLGTSICCGCGPKRTKDKKKKRKEKKEKYMQIFHLLIIYGQ